MGEQSMRDGLPGSQKANADPPEEAGAPLQAPREEAESEKTKGLLGLNPSLPEQPSTKRERAAQPNPETETRLQAHVRRVSQLLIEFQDAYNRKDIPEAVRINDEMQRVVAEEDAFQVIEEAFKSVLEETLKGLQNHTSSGIKDTGKARRKVERRFDYPEPDVEAELDAIRQRVDELAHLNQTVTSLGLEGADVRTQISGLHELGNRCKELARGIGMYAISEGNMTQIELSRLVSVHELTVGRWVKAAQEQQPQEK
jgi:hypothetical protein